MPIFSCVHTAQRLKEIKSQLVKPSLPNLLVFMEKRCIAIMQPGYFPWLGFFELMGRCDLFVFLDDVQYTKRDWRNRNRLRSSSGWQWITVPVLSRNHSKEAINDILINNTIDWRRKHLNIILKNYGKARFFNEYYRDIVDIYSRNWQNLSELTICSTLFIKDKLGITTPHIRSSSLKIKEKQSKRILEICRELRASELLDSKASRGFLDTAIFAKRNIKITFQDYKHPVYEQIHKPFMEYMSALDLLLNCGKESLNILLGSAHKSKVRN